MRQIELPLGGQDFLAQPYRPHRTIGALSAKEWKERLCKAGHAPGWGWVEGIIEALVQAAITEETPTEVRVARVTPREIGCPYGQHIDPCCVVEHGRKYRLGVLPSLVGLAYLLAVPRHPHRMFVIVTAPVLVGDKLHLLTVTQATENKYLGTLVWSSLGGATQYGDSWLFSAD